MKRFGEHGEVVGEHRFLGLYTSTAYRTSPREIPVLRGKVQAVLERAAFPPREPRREGPARDPRRRLPRDSLLQIAEDELFEIAIGLLGLGERPWVRLFVWSDPLDRFVSCLVTIPRDRYNTDNRERIGRILLDAFSGSAARLDGPAVGIGSRARHLRDAVHRRRPRRLRRRGARGAAGALDHARLDGRPQGRAGREHGEQQGLRLYRRYRDAFGTGVPFRHGRRRRRCGTSPGSSGCATARGRTSTCTARGSPAAEALRCKLYSTGDVSLSDVLPTFEHMGARVVDERPYRVAPGGPDPVWIYDFGLRLRAEDVESVRGLFEAAFLDARRGTLEDDGLNALVLAAVLPGREVTVLRAIAKYLRQAGIAYSDAYIERTLVAPPGHRPAAREDVPRPAGPGPVGLRSRRAARRGDGEGDRRRPEPRRGPDPAQLPGRRPRDGADQLLPERVRRARPSTSRSSSSRRPCRRSRSRGRGSRSSSTRRGSRASICGAARWRAVGSGGRTGRRTSAPRYSGLAKAQMIKNALIVPVGAKGGFVLKRPPERPGRAARGGDRLLPAVPRRAARPDRQHPRPGGRRARARGPLRRGRPLPGGRGGQGNRDVLGPRQRGRRPIRVLARATRSPRGAHTATTTSRWGSRRAARGRRSSGTSASSASTSRPSRSRSSGSATCRATCSATGCCCRARSGSSRRSTTGTCSSTRTRTPRAASPSASGCSSAATGTWADYDPERDLRGRRRPQPRAEVDRDHPAGRGGAVDRRRGVLAAGADPRDPARPGRPALERRHRHVREGEQTRRTPTLTTRPTTGCASTGASSAAGS